MDIVGGLRNIRQMSRDSMARTEQFLSGGGFGDNAGKPGDYGINGVRPNGRLTRGGGARMAGTGLINAVAGNVAQHLVEPMRAAIQPHFDGAIREVFSLHDVPTIASRN